MGPAPQPDSDRPDLADETPSPAIPAGRPDSSPPATRTSVCLLTPRGEGGISLIELRGPDAFPVLDRLFRSPRRIRPSELLPGQLLYGRLLRAGEMLDEVIIECATTRGTPCAIINCHGGPVAVGRILDALQTRGAVAISWRESLRIRRELGELNLVQAEAEERLPYAPTLRAFGILLDQFHGALEKAVGEMVERLGKNPGWEALSDALSRLLATATLGRGLTDPPRIAIVGKPNVGKSTLANALLRTDRSIVHHLPGTTRDTIEETTVIEGIPFLLVDTAGIRETDHAVEQAGIARSREELRQAAITLMVFDGSAPLDAEDERLLADRPADRLIAVANKSDLPRGLDLADLGRRLGLVPIAISGLTGAGIAELEQAILAALYPCLPGPGEPAIFTERQQAELRLALAAARRHDAAATRAHLRELLGESSACRRPAAHE